LPSPNLNPPPGSASRRGAVVEGLVARTARRVSHGARLRAPGGRVSRAAAEARSGSAMGGAAATPTADAEGLNQAPRSRSEAEAERSRRVWASGCVSPTGARRDRSRDRPDRADGGKRGQRSGIGAIPYREGGCGLARMQPAGAPQARSGRGLRHRREPALGGGVGRGRVAAVADRGRRAAGKTGPQSLWRASRRARKALRRWEMRFFSPSVISP